MAIVLKNREYEQLITATLLYLATFVFLNLFILAALSSIGFSFTNLVSVMGVAFLPAAFFGYLIAQHAQMGERATHRLLKKLLKDSLHEIKIPIATIRANTQMLGKNAEGKARDRVERIRQAAGKLEGLYEELDYFISREIQRSVKEPVALDRLVQERIGLREDELEGWQLNLQLDPVTIKADAMALKKIVDNLIDNAIKYSPPDRKSLSITLSSQQLIIADKGIGMTPDQVAQVFERFFQVNPHRTGFGIGLDIVKAACDENDISIRIDSEEAVGTAVTLDLTGVVVQKTQFEQ